MAVIDIMGFPHQEVKWDELSKKINPLSFLCLEIFPIPNTLGFERDAIGVFIPSAKGKDIALAINELKAIVSLLKDDFDFTELYNGDKLQLDNIDSICKERFKA